MADEKKTPASKATKAPKAETTKTEKPAPKAPKAETRIESKPETSRGGLDTNPVIPAAPVAAAPRPLAAPVAAKGGWWWGTGRRKRAVARVRIRPAKGEGKVLVAVGKDKTKTVEQYFAEDRDRAAIYAPLRAVGAVGKIDIVVRVAGGGFMGQAGAIVQGLARALKGYDPQMDAALRAGGYLTRDAREVERKKYGQAGARRRFQFSKR